MTLSRMFARGQSEEVVAIPRAAQHQQMMLQRLLRLRAKASQIRALRQRAAAVLDKLSDQICFCTDPAGRLTLLTPGLASIFGSRRPETLEDLGRALPVVAADRHRLEGLLATSSSDPAREERIELTDSRILSWLSIPVANAGRGWIVTDRTLLARSEVLEAALFRISELTRGELGLPDLLERIHHVIWELMDATNFFVAIFDQQSASLEFPYFVDERDPRPEGTIPLSGLTGWVLRHGRPVLADPAEFQRLIARGEIEDYGSPSVDWLGVPLIGSEGTFGVIGVQSYREEVRYTRRDLELLMFVAHHLAAVIEQRRREQALRFSESRYRELFDNNQAIKIVVDPDDGRLLDANPAACRFYGYSHEQITAMRIWEINTLPEAEVRQVLKNAKSGVQGYFNFRHRLASGEIRDVEIHSGPLDIGGRTVLYSIVHDVTERRRAEKALRRSEEHFRSLIENASDIIGIVDVQGTIHYNSPSVQRVLGYRPQKTIGGNIFDYAHPDDTASVRTLLENAASGERPQGIELRIRHRNGQWRILEGLAHRLDRETERVVVSCRDISDRRLAEQMLQTHAAAMEAAIDGIAIIDSRGRFSYVNRAFLHLVGLRRNEELVGRSWRAPLDKEWSKQFRTTVLEEFIRRGEWRNEIEIRARSGAEVPAEASLYQIGNGSTVCVLRDITERNLAAEQIRYLAYHDSLTGLANRVNFQDRLLLEISRAERENSKLGLIYLDLDRFKSINDSRGHHFGDQLLQEIGRRVRKAVDSDYLVSRLGGDEFTVLLTKVEGREDVVRTAEAILAAVREPVTILDNEVTCTTSLGVALFPDDGTDADTLKRNADKAMYQAKEQGRDRYQIFNPTLSAAALERIRIEGALRRARERDELEVEFQPIVSLETGRLHGFETLLRWNSAELGRVEPSRFIGIAESIGLMPSIGEWVLERACIHAREWHERGFPDLAVAVNLSMTQLMHRGLAARIAAALESSGLTPALLELEITESGAMENPESIMGELEELRSLGVRMSLDDFGIGHSSLSHLKRLPIQTLKIDQSFIRDLGNDDETGTIVRAMIDMAHTLKLVVIAEGVETVEQKNFLQQHGCDHLQGYLLSRPLPAPQVIPFLERHRRGSGR